VVWDEELPGYRRFYTVDGNDNRVEILAVGGGAKGPDWKPTVA
jgi:hypothetical protein